MLINLDKIPPPSTEDRESGECRILIELQKQHLGNNYWRFSFSLPGILSFVNRSSIAKSQI